MNQKIKAAAPTDRRSKVQAAGTAVLVLTTLAEMGGAATLTALAGQLAESPAKIHRYLASLLDSELVVQDHETSRYLLGPGAVRIGLAAMRQFDAIAVASTELAVLAETHRLSCFVAVLGNLGPSIVRWCEPPQTVTVNVRVGSVLPILWSATGRAFAAFSDSEQLQRQITQELKVATPEQRRLIPNKAAAEAMLQEARELGYVSIRDVLLVGVSAAAAPVFGASGKVVAVLTALGPTGSFDPDPKGRAAGLVLDAANAVSKRLGHLG